MTFKLLRIPNVSQSICVCVLEVVFMNYVLLLAL